MAATKSTSKRSTSSNGSRASKSSSPRKGSTSKRSTATRASANRGRTNKTTAVDRAKSAGQSLTDAAGKARTPLIAGGTALLGAAAGAAIKDRVSGRSKNPVKRIRDASIPKRVTKIDLETVKSAADRVSAYGQQASDIAAAVEKTRKKNG
jgi:hypothetical protein